jgi:hypothetical protein
VHTSDSRPPLYRKDQGKARPPQQIYALHMLALLVPVQIHLVQVIIITKTRIQTSTAVIDRYGRQNSGNFPFSAVQLYVGTSLCDLPLSDWVRLAIGSSRSPGSSWLTGTVCMAWKAWWKGIFGAPDRGEKPLARIDHECTHGFPTVGLLNLCQKNSNSKHMG